MTTPPLPATAEGLAGAAWARRAEAHAAIQFHRDLADLAAATTAIEPDGRVLAAAAEAAREEAVEAVMLWRTAVCEARRRAQAEAANRRRTA